MARITRAESFVYRAPISTPIRTSFGTMPNRPSVLIRIEDADGQFGWGEIWSNFPTIGAEYRARLFDAVIAPLLLEQGEAIDPRRFWQESDRALHLLALQTGEPGPLAGVLAAADIALHDLAARRAGTPLWRYLGGSDCAPVPVYASGINPGPGAVDTVQSCREKGFSAFKIKIGFGQASDEATLSAVAERLQPDERLMVDVNQGWDLSEACRMSAVLQQFPLFWIEEPLPVDRPAQEWLLLKSVASAPLAGGENLRDQSTFQQVLRDGYFSVLQPDMCKWGGMSGTLAVARDVIDSGKMFCPHFLAGGVGLAASLQLMAALGAPGFAELDVNPNPLREELIPDVFQLKNGEMTLPAAPGLGFEPDIAPFRRFLTQHTESRCGDRA